MFQCIISPPPLSRKQALPAETVGEPVALFRRCAGHVNDHEFRPTAGLELDSPVGDARSHQEVGIPPGFCAVNPIVSAHPGELLNLDKGEQLSPVGVAREHQIHAGLGLRVIVTGLVI